MTAAARMLRLECVRIASDNLRGVIDRLPPNDLSTFVLADAERLHQYIAGGTKKKPKAAKG